MKFSTREDIEAPIDYVFARASDFATFERQALRRGAQVKRIDDGDAYDVGAKWDVAFKFRNKDRKMQAELVSLDDPNFMRVDTVSSGLDAKATMELVSLSPKRTRIVVGVEMTAKSLSARLLLQSLKLAKGSLDDRFAARVRKFATNVEEDYRKGK
ncbi:SRPBCC family protein [Yoonia sp. 208BN28-4]|uniref:SRPBCC family protein n=1 Tax=Yoonia sp. 208BN28-4 TaxID=3126505 RepID=UPI0030A6601A